MNGTTTYYEARRTERALLCDFPSDAALIEGLRAMQSHLSQRGCPVEIPVLRVMNTAHLMVALMLSENACRERHEYDAMTYRHIGYDRSLMLVTLFVLAAMLRRTSSTRAHAYHGLITEDRSEDFYEGMSLYEQFIEKGETHFAEEDFLIDTQLHIQRLREENQRLTQENRQLKKDFETMKRQKQPQIVNNYHGPYIANNYVQDGGNQILSAENVYWSSDKQPEIVEPQPAEQPTENQDFFSCITTEARKSGHGEEVERLLRSAANASADKMVQCIRTNEALGYLDTKNLSSQALYDLLNSHFGLKYGVRNFTIMRNK